MTDVGFKVHGEFFSGCLSLIKPGKHESQPKFIKRISELDMFQSVHIKSLNVWHEYGCLPCVIEGIAKNPHIKRVTLDITNMQSHTVLTPLFRDRTFDQIQIIDHTDYRVVSSYLFLIEMFSSNFGPRCVNLARVSIPVGVVVSLLFESLSCNTRVQEYIGPGFSFVSKNTFRDCLNTNTTLTSICIATDVKGREDILRNAIRLKSLFVTSGNDVMGLSHVQNLPPNLERLINPPMQMDNMDILNALLAYIDRNKALVELNLTSSKWQPDILAEFLKAMETNTTLMSLTATVVQSNDEIEDLMPAAISSIIKNNSTLQQLTVRPLFPAYEYKSAIANIYKSLIDNYTLKELELACNDFYMAHHKVIKRNHSLCSFVLKHCRRHNFLDYLPHIPKPPVERKRALVSRPTRSCAKYNRIN